MKINIKGFQVSATFPSIALLAIVAISNFYTGYLLSFLAIITHEMGHLLAMLLCKNIPDGLEISAFDVRIIDIHRYSKSFGKDVFITVFGVISNFISCLIFLPFNKTYAYINLFIGILNLLPATTLDGGQLLFLFLNRKFTSKTSCKIIDVITILISFPLFVSGLLILLNSRYNFSLLFISVYLILSLFMRKDKIL